MYREAGTGGHAKSTVAGKVSALKQFKVFLSTKNMDYDNCSEDELCNESLIRQFGTFLIEHAVTPDGSLLMRDSATQYFSGMIQNLKDRFGKKVALFQSSETWNTEVRSDIMKLVTRRCIANGTEVKDKSKGVGRNLMIEIGEELLSTGTIKAIETRAILNTSYHAVGRGGEVALLTWDCLYWNYNEEHLGGKWNQQKTSDVQEMTFFADASDFRICEFHSLACYLAVGGGSRHISSRTASSVAPASWVFPSLRNINAASAITAMLKELAIKVEALHPDVSAKDIRVGSCNDLVNAEGKGTTLNLFVTVSHRP
jgi:hypothetical protein